MDKLKIIGEPLPDMPWEDRPADCKGTLNVLAGYKFRQEVPK